MFVSFSKYYLNIERKMPKNRENEHKIHDKELLGALHLLVFWRREADLCVDSDSREKVDRGGNGLKKIVHKQISSK